MTGEMHEQWKVVVNDEEQYSIWSADREVPAGWHETGAQGTKEECLAHIERVWTDMRPRSLRPQTAPETGAR
ncbi:MbtH family protein [Streptomyces sp. NPDC051567]|uniref:MbtH family protein n=1 Tax=Streptomyces sp. NPDC051567 TaxID=3365660 RepID=UPI0037AAE122